MTPALSSHVLITARYSGRWPAIHNRYRASRSRLATAGTIVAHLAGSPVANGAAGNIDSAGAGQTIEPVWHE